MNPLLQPDSSEELGVEQFDASEFVGLELALVSISLEHGLVLTFINHAGWLGQRIDIEFSEWRGLQVADGLGLVASCSFIPVADDLSTPGAQEYQLQCRFTETSSLLEVTVAREFNVEKRPARYY